MKPSISTIAIILAALLTACAAGGNKRYLKVHTDPIANQFTVGQVIQVLRAQGFEPQRWHDYQSGQTGVRIETPRLTKMKFRSTEHLGVEVYFIFYRDTNVVRMIFGQTEAKQLNPGDQAQYQAIEEGLTRVFGAEHIEHVNRPFRPLY